MPKPNRVQIIKYGPPPPELPVFGKVKPEEVSFIGRTNYVASLEEKKFIFGIKRIDRRRHLYIVGKSGVGKTKLLELLYVRMLLTTMAYVLLTRTAMLSKPCLIIFPKNA